MRSRGLSVILVAVLATACADGARRATYLTQTTERCPAADALTTQRTTQPLPADFRPVSVVRCTFGPTDLRPASPSGSGFTWSVAQRSSGPLDPLVDALRLEPQRIDGNPVCTAVLLPPVLVVLTDAAGTGLAPALPGTACQRPRPEVLAALDALTWTEIDRRP